MPAIFVKIPLRCGGAVAADSPMAKLMKRARQATGMKKNGQITESSGRMSRGGKMEMEWDGNGGMVEGRWINGTQGRKMEWRMEGTMMTDGSQ